MPNFSVEVFVSFNLLNMKMIELFKCHLNDDNLSYHYHPSTVKE